jgi:allantoin racemase
LHARPTPFSRHVRAEDGVLAEVRHLVPVPLVEQMIAAVRQAEAPAALSPLKATRGTFRRPSGKSSFNLPASLAARISS